MGLAASVCEAFLALTTIDLEDADCEGESFTIGFEEEGGGNEGLSQDSGPAAEAGELAGEVAAARQLAELYEADWTRPSGADAGYLATEWQSEGVAVDVGLLEGWAGGRPHTRNGGGCARAG